MSGTLIQSVIGVSYHWHDSFLIEYRLMLSFLFWCDTVKILQLRQTMELMLIFVFEMLL